MNIVEYAEALLERFDTTPFNPVDSLVLSQFSYFYFNDIVPGLSDPGSPVRIAELLKVEQFPQMLRNARDQSSNRRLLLALGMSPRFRDIRMCFYADIFDIAEQKQFAAVTYLLDDETAYIAYRGTDATFVGWKEDFNMTYTSPVPAQQEGARYLSEVAGRITHKLLVGGHSKGGNIAVYSAMEYSPSTGDRIIRVYSHDGPGFRDEIFTSEKYTNIKNRIHKTLPQSSLVGMLLQHQEDYFVVESKQFWIMQHDPLSWVVDKDDFHYTQSITSGAEHINTTISQWLAGIGDDKRELFITTLYGVVEAIGVVNFSDLNEDWHKKAAAALDAAKEIDPETRRFILGTIRSLAAMSVKNIRFPLRKE